MIGVRRASGKATGTTNWTQAGITLAPGVDTITVTATDDNLITSTDTITVTYGPTFPGATMAGAWAFEDSTAGTSAVDSSGNKNSGTLTPSNALWTTQGHSRQGIVTNGTNQYVVVPSALSLRYTQSFTFSAWVKPAVVGTSWSTIIEIGDIGGLYAFAPNPTPDTPGCGASTPTAWFVTNGGLNEFYACSPIPIPIGQWTHLAMTYNGPGPGSSLTLYVNGVIAATTPATGYIAPSAANLWIGRDEFGNYFNGAIDEDYELTIGRYLL